MSPGVLAAWREIMKMTNPILIALSIMVVWALSSLFIKVAVDNLGPTRALFWSLIAYVFIDVSFFVLLYFYYKVPVNFEMHSITAMIGAALSTAGFFTFYWLLQRTKVSIAVPLTALYPALTVVLAILVLKEKIKLVNAVGVLLAIAAGVLLAL